MGAEASIDIGIDIGISTTKIVFASHDKRLVMHQFETARSSVLKSSLTGMLNELLRDKKLTADDVSGIYLTGVGASFLDETLLGIKTVKVPEFEAIRAGALRAAKLRRALIISMGTGTAFVRADENGARHIGGTGIGGGTILGLARHLIDGADIDTVLKLAAGGETGNVDLRIKDILKDTIDSLPPELTASNFGKTRGSVSDADIILGIVNMVFEAIGMMALFSLRNDDIGDVILIGTLATFPYAKTVFDKFAGLTGKRFIIAPDAAFITALGTLTS